MIATLRGVVAEKSLDSVVLEVGGVGYGLLVTAEDREKLVGNEQTRLYVYEHIRENAYDLYGFTKVDTKQLFEQLLGVNGVGPKMALSVLNTGNSSAVRASIANGDVKSLQQASGVGKRVAERIVVELKDKVGLVGVDLETTGLLQSDANVLQDEAAQALVALGYHAADAAAALVEVPKDISTEDRVKQALKGRA